MRSFLLELARNIAVVAIVSMVPGCPESEPVDRDVGSRPDAATLDAPNESDVAVLDAFPAPRPSCDELVVRCHDVDPGSGPIHECHELGHDESATEAECAARLMMCVALCSTVDAGTHHADAHHGHMH